MCVFQRRINECWVGEFRKAVEGCGGDPEPSNPLAFRCWLNCVFTNGRGGKNLREEACLREAGACSMSRVFLGLLYIWMVTVSAEVNPLCSRHPPRD